MDNDNNTPLSSPDTNSAKPAATKTKKTTTSESGEVSNASAKRRVGRPKGSKNKAPASNTESAVTEKKATSVKTARKSSTSKDSTSKSTKSSPKQKAQPKSRKAPKVDADTPSGDTNSPASTSAPSVAEVTSPSTPEASAPSSESSSSQEGSYNKEASSSKKDRRERAEENINYGTIETVGGEGNSGQGNKRNKRRRNRRGNSDNPNAAAAQGTTRPMIDPDEQQRYAWKIFLGEVTEEGIGFMDDRAASDIARRAFRLAEIYLTEASRWGVPSRAQSPVTLQGSTSAPVAQSSESLEESTPEDPASASAEE